MTANHWRHVLEKLVLILLLHYVVILLVEDVARVLWLLVLLGVSNSLTTRTIPNGDVGTLELAGQPA